jgi:hypothetical protein
MGTTRGVADPHHFNGGPDPALHCNADPELTFHFDADLDPAFGCVADPDLTFHFNADPEPDRASYQSNAYLRPLVYRLTRAPF